MFLFIANYSRELRMGVDIKKRGKMEKAMEIVKNKESARESGSSIEKGTRGNKVAGK